MHQRMVRRFGAFEYLAVVEPQKRGAAHVHVVYRGGYIPQRWLSRSAAEAGFGRIADIRRSHRKLTSYLAKYLTKQLANQSTAQPGGDGTPMTLPKYFRRVRWSRGWCEWQAPAPSRVWRTWRIADAGQAATADDAAGRGYTVVDLVISGANARLGTSGLVRWMRSLRGYRPWAVQG
jgi:hypothetical protein